jgi:hypothetical protein
MFLIKPLNIYPEFVVMKGLQISKENIFPTSQRLNKVVEKCSVKERSWWKDTLIRMPKNLFRPMKISFILQRNVRIFSALVFIILRGTAIIRKDSSSRNHMTATFFQVTLS